MLELTLMSLCFSFAGLALARGLELIFRDPRDRQWLWRIALMVTALPVLACALDQLGLRLPIQPVLTLDGFDVGLTGQAAGTAGVAAAPVAITGWSFSLEACLMAAIAGVLVWRAGVAIFAAISLTRALKSAAPEPASAQLCLEASRAAATAGLLHTPETVEICSRHSAFVTGLWSGKIHVSREAMAVLTPAERHVILVHECTHIRRGDLIWRRVERAVCDLFAWLPPVWFARARLEALRELACDREAIAQLGKQGRAKTGFSLFLLGLIRRADHRQHRGHGNRAHRDRRPPHHNAALFFVCHAQPPTTKGTLLRGTTWC
jgi:Zn-dependent protease with chaperone function